MKGLLDYRVSIARHPLFMCGFRPFFVLTAASATLFMAAWLAAGLVGLACAGRLEHLARP